MSESIIEKYERTVCDIINNYAQMAKENDNIISFILRGSVAHKMASKYSDLDIRLVVSTNSVEEQSNEYYKNDVPVHVIVYTLDYIKKMLDGSNLIILDLVINDKIIVDKNDTMLNLRKQYENFSISREIYNKYMDAAKSSMINAIDLYNRGDWKGASLNIRDSSMKLAYLRMMEEKIFRPKCHWINLQLEQIANDTDDIFYKEFCITQDLNNAEQTTVKKDILSLGKMIQYIENKFGLKKE